jgi:hypothetical protein
MEELKRDSLTQDQRVALLLRLADLELLAAHKHDRKRKSQQERDLRRRPPRYDKPGGHKKTHDSAGNPLYQGIPPREPIVPKDNEKDALNKFLDTINPTDAKTQNNP